MWLTIIKNFNYSFFNFKDNVFYAKMFGRFSNIKLKNVPCGSPVVQCRRTDMTNLRVAYLFFDNAQQQVMGQDYSLPYCQAPSKLVVLYSVRLMYRQIHVKHKT